MFIKQCEKFTVVRWSTYDCYVYILQVDYNVDPNSLYVVVVFT